MKQLRGSDIHEAPLLFQAASSNSIDCFTRVRDELRHTLGRGELRQQLLAKDLNGKTIVFHAACSEKAEVLKAVLDMLANEKGEAPGKQSWLTLIPKSESQEKRPVWTTVNDDDVQIDLEEKTILHHACRNGIAATVRKVIEEAKSHGEAFLHTFLRRSDYLGQTALMNALRSQKGDVLQKLDALLELMTPEEKIEAMTQSTENFFSTALVHAAHGGFKQLDIARKKIFELAENTRCNNADGDLDLNATLGVSEDSPDIFKRYGALLADVAYGGDVDMLKHVVSMIQVQFEV